MRSILVSGPWRRAPVLLLRRSPAVVVAVAAAGLIVGAAASAEPLFLSSAGNAAVAKQNAERCSWDVGMSVRFLNHLGPPDVLAPGLPAAAPGALPEDGVRLLSDTETAVRRAGSGVPALASPSLTMRSQEIFDVGRDTSDRSQEGRLVYRTGSLDHVVKIQDSHRPGIWLTDTEANQIHRHAGQMAELSHGSLQVAVPIAGVYHDLVKAPPAPYWCSLQDQIRQIAIFSEYVPPPLVLVDRQTFISLSQRLGALEAITTWEVPLRNQVTVSQAQGVTAAFRRALFKQPLMDVTLNQGNSSGLVTQLDFIVAKAKAIRGAVRRSITPVALAGLLVALVLIGAAGSYWVERRVSEVRLLAAKGIGPPAIAAKAVLEMALPTIGGGLLGWLAAREAVPVLGPSTLVEGAAVHQALILTGWAILVSLVVAGAVAGARVRVLTERPLGAKAGWLRWVPAELALLAGADWSLTHISSSSATLNSSTAVPRVDVLPLVFPLLLLTGAAVVALRLYRALLLRLRSAGSRWPHALFLTARRLAAGQHIALALVAATTLSIGILVYASALTRSSQASIGAKAEVFVGSDARIAVEGLATIPPSLRNRATIVRRPSNVLAGDQSVDLIAVDTATFARAAYWDASFGAESLGSMLGRLGTPAPGQPAPAIVANGGLASTALTYDNGRGQVPLRVRVVDRVSVFPSEGSQRTLVIVDRSALAGQTLGVGDEIWARGPSTASAAEVISAGIPVTFVASTAKVLDVADFLAITWTFGFLESLGVLTALITIGGLLLYLDTRQRSRRISYALARRMGLRRRTHLVALGCELTVTLVTGFLLGAALSATAARLVYRRLDPVRTLPPGPLLRQPLGVIAMAAVAVLATAALAAMAAQRTAERVNLAEVLRANA